jgi:uncharacterized metal-binding protein
MSCKEIFRPSWFKVIAVIFILLFLYVLIAFSMLNSSYTCRVSGEKCAEEVAKAMQDSQETLFIIFGIPISIIAWIIIGLIETRSKKRGKNEHHKTS